MKLGAALLVGVVGSPYLISDIKLYHSQDTITLKYINQCESLTSKFVSTFWLNLGLLQSYYGSSSGHLKSDAQKVKHITYSRELLHLEDGGICSLDWIESKSNKILFILPGLTGGSDADYIKHIVLEGVQRGFTVVVMNGRGLTGTPLNVSCI